MRKVVTNNPPHTQDLVYVMRWSARHMRTRKLVPKSLLAINRKSLYVRTRQWLFVVSQFGRAIIFSHNWRCYRSSENSPRHHYNFFSEKHQEGWSSKEFIFHAASWVHFWVCLFVISVTGPELIQATNAAALRFRAVNGRETLDQWAAPLPSARAGNSRPMSSSFAIRAIWGREIRSHERRFFSFCLE